MMQEREINEAEELVLREGLAVILEAAEGRPQYPIEELRRIAAQVEADCLRLGFTPPDTSFLWEERSTGSDAGPNRGGPASLD